MLYLRFRTQRRQPRRRQVCARRDALSSWHEVRRPLSHRPGPSTHARDCRRRSEAPPAPAAPSCRRHTGAPQARLDPPPRTPFAPQARLDPPPRTPLRRRLVSILHPGGERARRGLLPSARTAGCVVVFVIAELRAPSRSCTRCRCHAPRLPVLLARAASSASRVPSAWRPSRPRGPAPAVHACPRQRLGLGRSALVGDLAAAARREPRRRPDGKSVRSCESSPGAVCCVQCNTVRSHSFGLGCGPLESI